MRKDGDGGYFCCLPSRSTYHLHICLSQRQSIPHLPELYSGFTQNAPRTKQRDKRTSSLKTNKTFSVNAGRRTTTSSNPGVNKTRYLRPFETPQNSARWFGSFLAQLLSPSGFKKFLYTYNPNNHTKWVCFSPYQPITIMLTFLKHPRRRAKRWLCTSSLKKPVSLFNGDVKRHLYHLGNSSTTYCNFWPTGSDF